ncbi:hypothetical protein ACWEV3_32435 [Saccharopolyspora sp. NPDC003752]
MNEELLDRVPRTSVDMEEIRRIHETALQKAASGKNPIFAELAREVQAGRMSLRDAACSSAYGEAFAESADRFLHAIRGLSTDDLRKAAEENTLDGLLARELGSEAPARTETAMQAPEPEWNEDDDDAYFEGSFLQSAIEVDRSGSSQQVNWTRHGRR